MDILHIFSKLIICKDAIKHAHAWITYNYDVIHLCIYKAKDRLGGQCSVVVVMIRALLMYIYIE